MVDLLEKRLREELIEFAEREGVMGISIGQNPDRVKGAYHLLMGKNYI